MACHASGAQEILTLLEAAELLRVSPRGLQRLVREGAVPFAMVGGLLRFRRTRLLAWLDSGGTLPGVGGARGRSLRRARVGRKGEPDVLGVLADLGAEAMPLDSKPGSG
jgi:excisionase family DNA binding protein